MQYVGFPAYGFFYVESSVETGDDGRLPVEPAMTEGSRQRRSRGGCSVLLQNTRKNLEYVPR